MSSSADSLDLRFRTGRLVCLVVGVVLAARLVQLQVVQHDRWQEEARRQWLQATDIPARRGDLLDRAGRPLALTISSYRVGVSGGLVANPEALAAVLADVFGGTPTEHLTWLRGLGSRYQVLARQTALDHGQLQTLARFPAVNVEEQLGRVYPLDGVGASLVGFYRVHQDSTRQLTGLELGLDAQLAGEPGRAQRVRSGRPGQDHGSRVVTPARHGDHVTLTIDADLQEICESRLARAVPATESSAGSVIIVDPRQGEVLAAASWPLIATREQPVADAAAWVNRNFTVPYEPGSVFKIFTASALLTCGAVDTSTVFDCTDTRFDGFTIGEAAGHQYGRLSFMEAFERSSNVWFARAVDNMAPREHHRMLLDFGFARGTGLPYPAEGDGILASPSTWSRRSQPTIAIGQELSATPLQLAMAVAAVANGGVLLAPRLIAAVHDAEGNLVHQEAGGPLRRVMPADVAAVVRQAMVRVVDQGTGQVVARDWADIAGKTGTAQKARPGEGYAAGLHTATFTGFLPADDPRLVIVAVLDEPSYRHHYAAQSAAPLFGDIVDDIRRTTSWLDAPGREGIRVHELAAADLVPVPDLLLLDGTAALERLRLVGLTVRGPYAGGEVVMQVPSPGSLVPKGTEVSLTMWQRDAAGPEVCPDLRGLSNRQAQALAARLGLELTVTGTGYVAAQQPPPGRPLDGRKVAITMEAPWP